MMANKSTRKRQQYTTVLQANLMVEFGGEYLRFAKLFLPTMLGAVVLRPEAAGWIAAYTALTVCVGFLGCFMRAAGRQVLSTV